MSTRITGLSPLDQIRLVEAEVARRLVAAREVGEEKVARARAHAEQIVYAARDAGRKEGETHYNNILLNAEEEAQTIISQAHRRAVELGRRGRQRIEPLTLTATEIITGVKGEPRANEH